MISDLDYAGVHISLSKIYGCKQGGTKRVAVVALLPENFSENPIRAGNIIVKLSCQEIWGNWKLQD